MQNDFETKLDKYAELAVKTWLNVQPGQRLLIVAPIEAVALVRLMTKHAYQIGSPLVTPLWLDEQLDLLRFQYAPRDSFELFPEAIARTITEAGQRGDAFLSIAAADPNLLVDQDPTLVALAAKTRAQHLRPFSELAMRNAFNWLVVSLPIPSWSAQVFPDAPKQEQMEKLWDAIFHVCRVDQPDPIAAWQQHLHTLSQRAAFLNQKQYDALEYRGAGTQLTIGLAPMHQWVSGAEKSERGISFVANAPTEEIFTMPHRERAEGYVTSTKPLSIRGVSINEFKLTFQNGRVVQVQASNHQTVMEELLANDQGAARLGEVALVSQSNPLAQLNIQFHNGLYDENAASHLALGRAYPTTLRNGAALNQTELVAAGANDSLIHLDFMIGSGEMDIDGVCANGTREPVMRAGEWAFEI